MEEIKRDEVKEFFVKIYDIMMWMVLLLTILVLVAVTWPVYFARNALTIAKRELILFLAVLFLALDQFTKWLVLKYMYLGQSIPVVKGFFYLTYVQNQGAAFGLFQKKLYLFITVAVLSISAILYYSIVVSPTRKWIQVALAFLLAGALGNLIDRLQFGYVIDFLDFRFGMYNWPVFNIADVVIDLGVGMLLVEMLWESGEEQPEEVCEKE